MVTGVSIVLFSPDYLKTNLFLISLGQVFDLLVLAS